MPSKAHLNVSIDSELIRIAKSKKVNISDVVEQALVKRVHKLQEVSEGGAYPFELCERKIPDHNKKTLWGTAGIRARRCQDCGLIWFVNDTVGEFTICRNCWGKDAK